MAGTSDAMALVKAHGKEIMTAPENTKLATLKATDLDKTIYVKVYRKWTVTNKASLPAMHCCILLDQEGGAIQANTRPREKDRFNMLELNKTYTIKGFGFQDATAYMQTVPHPLALAFGRYTDIKEAPDMGFPKHYFTFVPYADLYLKVDEKVGLLTDYVGYVQYVSELLQTVKDSKETLYWRDIGIQDLERHTVRFTLWNDKARHFRQKEYEESEKPTVIAVTSCVVKNYGGLQLSNTAATTYYFNPDIPQTNEIRAVYSQLLEPPTIPNIQYQRCADIENEKKRNRVKLQDLITENPNNCQKVRFTAVATIRGFNERMPWFYARCLICRSKISPRFPHVHCNPTGSDDLIDYSYCFKAYIYDATGQIMVTCFSDEAHSIVQNCNEVVRKLQEKNPYILPPELIALRGRTYVFQLHYGPDSTQDARFFIFDNAWATTAALPAPPAADAADLPIGIPIQTTATNEAQTSVTIAEISEDWAETTTPLQADKRTNLTTETPATDAQQQLEISEPSTTKDEQKSTKARKALFQGTKTEATSKKSKKTD